MVLRNPMTMEDPIIIRDVPRLHYAEIIHLPHLKADLPWEQLTSLTYRGRTTAETIAVLRDCPNLLDFSCGSTAMERATPPLQLSFLRSLKVTDQHMLHCLTVPRLEQLQISYVAGDIDAATDALQLLVSLSSCDLRSLSVGLLHRTAAQIQRFVRAANSIRNLKLSLSYPIEFEPLIMALQGGDDVLPQLKHLQIHDEEGGKYYRQLLGVLRWRQTHATLESFELFLGAKAMHIPPEVMADFRALAETGFQVRVVKRERGVDVTLLDTHPA
ncbi:hypothetical protein B0H19DRAFT_1365302 [Mycena capillaripes]|nr:hypothetical protein B0H19DRAFT_1365302 [Mycena capillaripes]